MFLSILLVFLGQNNVSMLLGYSIDTQHIGSFWVSHPLVSWQLGGYFKCFSFPVCKKRKESLAYCVPHPEANLLPGWISKPRNLPAWCIVSFCSPMLSAPNGHAEGCPSASQWPNDPTKVSFRGRLDPSALPAALGTGPLAAVFSLLPASGGGRPHRWGTGATASLGVSRGAVIFLQLKQVFLRKQVSGRTIFHTFSI